MNSVSFDGLKDVATFELASASSFVRGIDEGTVVKVSAARTAAKCADGDNFHGVIETIDYDQLFGAVKLAGLVTVPYTGSDPAVGRTVLVANSTGGVKTAASGNRYLVVDVDTSAKTVTFMLPGNENVTTSLNVTVGDAAFGGGFGIHGLTVTPVVDEAEGTIAIAVPSGTVVTALKATFSVTAGTSVKVGGESQISGTTENDFTNPVTYVVTPSGGLGKAYIVTVTESGL